MMRDSPFRQIIDRQEGQRQAGEQRDALPTLLMLRELLCLHYVDQLAVCLEELVGLVRSRNA